MRAVQTKSRRHGAGGFDEPGGDGVSQCHRRVDRAAVRYGIPASCTGGCGGDDATPEVQAALIKGITDGVRERGKGQRGDKTMLDAWIPATEAAANAVRRSASAEEMWRDILAAAEAGAALTCSMVAARGTGGAAGRTRLGHLDPGAASAVVILKAMAQTFCGDDAKPMKIVGDQFSLCGKFVDRGREAQNATASLETAWPPMPCPLVGTRP